MAIIQNFGDSAGTAGDAYGGGGIGSGGAVTGISSTSFATQVDSTNVGAVAAPVAAEVSPGASSIVNSINSEFPISSPTQVNLQILPEGFGSYLQNILPDDIAAAAGAFGASMQQIKNVRKLDIEKFAQVVTSLETTAGLNLVNGTNVPTDTTEAQAALALIALGSGPYGTYTFSDLFGCMSGLPYPWKDIQSAIIGLQSSTLSTIYQQLYLAVTWEQATGTVTPAYTTSAVETPPLSGNYNYYYQITAITGASFGNVGGGYGRGSAAAPTATINGGSGATINIIIDTNPANVATTYGRVTGGLLNSTGSSVNYGSGSSPTPSAPPATLSVTIQEPPTTYGGSGWPAMNTAVQHYIDAANAEIAIIRTTHPGQSVELNDMWDNIGTQLGIEQKARNLALTKDPPPNVPPPTIDRYGDLFPYPIMIYSFTDTVPSYSKLTQPNMAAQTLEAISDLTKVSGESIVGMMRSERNQARLIEAGIILDDNIPDVLPFNDVSTAYPNNVEPVGIYDPITENYVTPDGIIGAPNSSVAAVLGIGTPDGLPVPSPDIGIGTEGISQVSAPSEFFTGPAAGGGEGSQGGGPIVPGSLAGSPYTKLIPPALNPVYTSDVLLPAALSVTQAIEQVITCNCDCWVQ